MVLAALPMFVIVVLVGVLISISFQSGIIGTADAKFTLSNYVDLFSDPIIEEALYNTIIFSITATLVSMGIGLPIAWLTERTTMRAKSAVYAIMTLGLLIPGIYTAMGWTFLAHSRIGFLNRWAVEYFSLSEAPINIATPIGMGFVQGLSLAALAFILTAQMFRAMNPSLEEAAKIHGLGFIGTMRRVTLPLAMPAILAAVIYIVVIGIATFDVPAIIGLANRVFSGEDLLAKAIASGRSAGSRGPVAVALAKRVIEEAQDANIRTAHALEQQAFGLVFASDDRLEGMDAFLEKRDPVFSNR